MWGPGREKPKPLDGMDPGWLARAIRLPSPSEEPRGGAVLEALSRLVYVRADSEGDLRALRNVRLPGLPEGEVEMAEVVRVLREGGIEVEEDYPVVRVFRID